MIWVILLDNIDGIRAIDNETKKDIYNFWKQIWKKAEKEESMNMAYGLSDII